MNNTVLQKLLHGHVLLSKNPLKFTEHFIAPQHVGFETGFGTNGVPKSLLQDWMKSHAQRIQQSMKFYLPQVSAENTLSKEEVSKLSSDLEMYLPYKSTFVQHEVDIGISSSEEATELWNKLRLGDTNGLPPSLAKLGDKSELIKSIEQNYITGETCIANVYLEDLETFDDEGKPMFKGNVSTYFKEDGDFFLDPNDYVFSYRDDGSYTFWLTNEMPFHKYTDTGSDQDDGMYNNATLNSMVSVIINVHCQLMLMLNYPQIVNKQEVQGISPINGGKIPFSRNYSSSEFLRKPKYEHKILKLDLFGSNEPSGKVSSGDSGSRAFHAVRKHIRQYSDGKITFVKAHFRGSKDAGIVTKDYEIVQRQKS